MKTWDIIHRIRVSDGLNVYTLVYPGNNIWNWRTLDGAKHARDIALRGQGYGVEAYEPLPSANEFRVVETFPYKKYPQRKDTRLLKEPS